MTKLEMQPRRKFRGQPTGKVEWRVWAKYSDLEAFATFNTLPEVFTAIEALHKTQPRARYEIRPMPEMRWED